MTTKKTLTAAAALLLALPLSAQDIYQMEKLSGSDLNGTARFVGMGGAMSSLGADLSTMTTNPAGIGLYRRSDIALSASVLSQPNAEEFYDRNKAQMSFDQAGFVYAMPIGDDVRYVNFGFNYQKRRNLKSYIGVNNIATGGISQTQQMSQDIANNGNYASVLSVAGYNSYLVDGNDTEGYDYFKSNRYNSKRVQYGGVHEYDFHISMNWNDQIYAGLTFGVYDVNMHSRAAFASDLVAYVDNEAVTDEYSYLSEEEVTGTGYDVKFGVILRPIEDSPFRIGVAVHTPIFFDLTSRQYLYNMTTPFGWCDENNTVHDGSLPTQDQGPLDYMIRTPWKFNISAATIVANVLAIDAEYEYRDYGSARVRYPRYDGWWKDSWNDSDNDEYLEQEAKHYLKGVSTFRIGAEWRVIPGAYLRLGYNYESSPFSKDAYLNLLSNSLSNNYSQPNDYSPSNYYKCYSDYANLSAINRVTAGFGVRGKHWYADFAYQYQHQTADYYGYHVPAGNSDINGLPATKVDLNRHQALLTIGYKF